MGGEEGEGSILLMLDARPTKSQSINEKHIAPKGLDNIFHQSVLKISSGETKFGGKLTRQAARWTAWPRSSD